jgi:TolB protein
MTTSKRSLGIIVIALVIACTERIAAPTAPSRPTNLQVQLLSASSAQLKWSSTAQEPVTFDVYRNDVKVTTTSTSEYTDTGLAGNTTYTWFVVARTSDGGVSAPSDPAVLFIGDNAAPTVTGTSPANNATSVSRLPAPAVTFSEPMIPGSVNATTLTAKVAATGATIYGTVNYDAATKTADFWPITFLSPSTNITITVNGARDLAGNPMTPFTFSFVTGTTPASPNDLPATTEQILISQRDLFVATGLDVFRVSADGSTKTNLTDRVGNDIDAAWSPDGRHIAFATDRNGTYDIYIMREDGRGLTQLTSEPSLESQPTWSPDAQKIIFKIRKDEAGPGGTNIASFDFFTMNPDGTQQTNLTRTPDLYEEWASLSPDGRRLLFSRITVNPFNMTIMIANADGSGALPLRAADARYEDDVASWSSDGSRIVFSAYDRQSPMYSEVYRLFLINPDGSNLQLLPTPGGARYPAWSRSGAMISYSNSNFNEFWGRFGQVEVRRHDLATGSDVALTGRLSTNEVLSPQAWRR